ncbi:hypothetical protein [Pigmentiphaga sp. H8]|nr:hypothetical protein [Pigmentiphaga sp. H8]
MELLLCRVDCTKMNIKFKKFYGDEGRMSMGKTPGRDEGSGGPEMAL